MKAKYVIIGNSAAGIGAVEGIRRIDKDNKIIILSDEPHHTYSRPLISYLLKGKTTRENMVYRDKEFYLKNNCRLIAPLKSVGIDPIKKEVHTQSGDKIAYDKLLVAAGSSPFIPPMEGLDSVKNKFTFMSFDDALALKNTLTASSKVLVIGAGLIGLKCVEGILDSVGKITVVDLAPNILSSILDSEGSDMIRDIFEEKGVSFRLSESVKYFGTEGSSDGTYGYAALSSGEKILFDILVLAVGVRPNIQLVKDIGGKTGRGITVNNKMETSVNDIYSAGDCVESHDVSSGQNKVMALLPNAYIQGECAGVNMAGGEAVFDKGIPMNAIGFWGKHILTAGNYTGDIYYESSDGNYKKLFYSDNKLNGYILIGNIEKAGIYTNLIKERMPLDKLDFELICKQPCLMAFTGEERKVKLGGLL